MAIQRRFPRYDLQLQVFYRKVDAQPDEARVGRTRDLSEGGACLELPESLLPGTHLALRLPALTRVVEPEADVVWTRELDLPWQGALHGARFIALTPEDRQALVELFPPMKTATVLCPLCKQPVTLSKRDVAHLRVRALAVETAGEDAYAFGELLEESSSDHYEVPCPRCECTIFFALKQAVDRALESS